MELECSIVWHMMKRVSWLGLGAVVALCFGTRGVAGQEKTFLPYTNCKISDGPELVDTAPLAPGVTERTVDTSRGKRQVAMLAGRRVMFAYPGKDFFANVKVENLPEKNYAEARQNLINNFDYILASEKDGGRNHGLKPLLNGVDARGLDRNKMEGGVLGVYLLFDDAARVVITIYFLNQDAKDRSFQSMEEYKVQRDKFLRGFTSCMRPSAV